MPLTIKNVIEKYDDIFGEKHHKICTGKNCECHKEVKQFLQNELTLMLDDILIELPKIAQQHNPWCEVLEDKNMPCDCGVSHHNAMIKEIINIINKHR